MYHRNIFESSSKVFGNLRKFSEILEKCSGTFVWPSEKFWKIFGRWSEIFGKSSKTLSSAGLYNKKNITRRLEDMNFIFSWQKQYFTHSLRSFVKYCFCHSKIKFISSRHRVISSIYFVLVISAVGISVWKAKWCKIQETKLTSRSTKSLSRLRQVSVKLNKINSRSTK